MEVLVLDRRLSLGERVRVQRALRRLTQMDVARLATHHMRTIDNYPRRVRPRDVSLMEHDVTIHPIRRRAILEVLGIEDPFDLGQLNGYGWPEEVGG